MCFWNLHVNKEEIDNNKKVKHLVRLLLIVLWGKINSGGRAACSGVGAEIWSRAVMVCHSAEGRSRGRVEVRGDLVKVPVSLLLPWEAHWRVASRRLVGTSDLGLKGLSLNATLRIEPGGTCINFFIAPPDPSLGLPYPISLGLLCSLHPNVCVQMEVFVDLWEDEREVWVFTSSTLSAKSWCGSVYFVIAHVL